ncbi:hypothetical protein UT300018_07030 [Clostridium faecium]
MVINPNVKPISISFAINTIKTPELFTVMVLILMSGTKIKVSISDKPTLTLCGVPLGKKAGTYTIKDVSLQNTNINTINSFMFVKSIKVSPT